jgi:Family of unknown function (DUF6448)
MPPHCDSLDGPVVTAARSALEADDVDLVLAYVPAAGEAEVRQAFRTALGLRGLGVEVRELADRWFFENVVRIHRAGEGAPYTGLKPAGLDVGPVLPAAERALESGSPAELVALLADAVREEVERRLAHVLELRQAVDGDLAARRRAVEATLGFEVWANGLHAAARAEPHAAHEVHWAD